MSKTIQVRVNDQLKDSADALFTSLGLDTSTAIRMFLVASMENNGIPFTIGHNIDYGAVRKAIDYRTAGGEFFTVEQSLDNMRIAIKEGTLHEN